MWLGQHLRIFGLEFYEDLNMLKLKVKEFKAQNLHQESHYER